MKLYSVCHKEFRHDVIKDLTLQECKHVAAYIVNENFPKDYSRFSGFVSHVREFELPKYNLKYQANKYFEYGTIAHIYLNECLRDTHVGILHSDIVFEEDSVNEMLEEFNCRPDTIFFQTFFGPELHPETLHPLYLTEKEAHLLGNYLAIRMQIPTNVDRVLRDGWIGGMAAGPLDIFLRFGEFLETYSEELEQILAEDRWHLQTWPGKHTICGIIERMWGIYLMSLGLPIKRMRIRHEQKQYQHDHK